MGGDDDDSDDDDDVNLLRLLSLLSLPSIFHICHGECSDDGGDDEDEFYAHRCGHPSLGLGLVIPRPNLLDRGRHRHPTAQTGCLSNGS